MDREKVIKGLESQLDDLQKYADADEVLTLTQNQAKDILALLKEQEAVRPEREHSGGGTTWWNVCGNCGTAINPNDKYCHECGRAVKWE